jgi:uncharacterized protein DUF3574
MKNSLLGVLLFTAVASFGCAEEDMGSRNDPAVGEAENEASQSVCPAGGSIFARTELFFGLSRSGGPDITEAEFAAFVDTKVTPRFPDGLTLLDGDGQFRLESGEIAREGSKVLILLHGGSKPESNNIEAIRTDYKAQFQQESVLRTDEVECVSF